MTVAPRFEKKIGVYESLVMAMSSDRLISYLTYVILY
jgi:hypothetical protein